jgi:signal transduction histidine kinase
VNGDVKQTTWRHDLKNHLGIVLGFSELLLARLDPDNPIRVDVQEIHLAAQRALHLVRTIASDDSQ